MQEYYGMFPETRNLQHHGIKGQSWGIRRFQNEDGSLTALGKQKRAKETGARTILRDDNVRNEISVSADSRNQVSLASSSFSSISSEKISEAANTSVAQANSSSQSIESGKTAVEKALSSSPNFTVNKFNITREAIQNALNEKRAAENKKKEKTQKKTEEKKTEETKTEETKKKTIKKTAAKKTTKKTAAKKTTQKKTTQKKTTKKTAAKKTTLVDTNKNRVRGPRTTAKDLERASTSPSRRAADNFLKQYQIKR